MVRNTRAFTLIELSIVLIIIGLLVGGVLAGRDLIRQAEFRSILSDFQRYELAMNTFALKYNAIPGDMDNATSYWGDDAVDCADAGIADGSPGTCNGNGNDNINGISEGLRAWQHLGLSSIISGNYTGEEEAEEPTVRVGINLPEGPANKLGYLLKNNATYGYSSNGLQVGLEVSGAQSNGAFLTPTEAYDIDLKGDDGIPHTGKIFGMWGNGFGSDGTCVDDNSDPSNYVLTVTAEQCILRYYFEGYTG